MYEYHNLALLKAENPEAYKKLAQEGIMVAHPVTIKGQHSRPDTGTGYHATVKFFDPSKDHPTAIHDVARTLKMTPPDPHSTQITPDMFKDRFGNDVYVLKLHGDHADQIKEHNGKFSHMGYPASYEFTPHVSVDKATWEHIVDSGAKTAHEAGIEFGHAQLKQGPKLLTTYKHGHVPTPKAAGDKLAASETMELQPLEKGFKQAATTAMMASVIGMSAPTNVASPSPYNRPAQQASNGYSAAKMLRTIASVESSGGKFNHHRMMQEGLHEGDAAFGKYALMPNTIRDTVRMNRDLKSKYGKVASLDGQDLQHFMQDNPGLEDQIAQHHLARLEHHFGQDPAKIGYAWLNGVSGTYKAGKENKDINSHWHVRKIVGAYGKDR